MSKLSEHDHRCLFARGAAVTLAGHLDVNCFYVSENPDAVEHVSWEVEDGPTVYVDLTSDDEKRRGLLPPDQIWETVDDGVIRATMDYDQLVCAMAHLFAIVAQAPRNVGA